MALSTLSYSENCRAERDDALTVRDKSTCASNAPNSWSHLAGELPIGCPTLLSSNHLVFDGFEDFSVQPGCSSHILLQHSDKQEEVNKWKIPSRDGLQCLQNGGSARTGLWHHDMKTRNGRSSPARTRPFGIDEHVSKRSREANRLAQKRYRERRKEKTLCLERQIQDLSKTAERLVVDIALLKRQNAALESKLHV